MTNSDLGFIFSTRIKELRKSLNYSLPYYKKREISKLIELNEALFKLSCEAVKKDYGNTNMNMDMFYDQ